MQVVAREAAVVCIDWAHPNFRVTKDHRYRGNVPSQPRAGTEGLNRPGSHQHGQVTLASRSRLGVHDAVPKRAERGRDAVGGRTRSIHRDAQALRGNRSVAKQRWFEATQ